MSLATYMNCEHDNCFLACVIKLISIIKYTFKLYSVVHLGPVLVFRYRDLLKNPKDVLFNTLVKIARSMTFLGGWMFSMRAYFCLTCNFKIKVDNLYFLFLTLAATMPAYAETTQRLNDYNVFLLPKAAEGFWDLFVRLNYVKTIPHFDKLIFVIALTLALYIRKYHNKSIPKNYEKILKFVFGNK